jgi:hypothetical protein
MPADLDSDVAPLGIRAASSSLCNPWVRLWRGLASEGLQLDLKQIAEI